jgi:hypothetical protein
MNIQLSKYTVEIKDDLTWGDAEHIQSVLSKGAKMKMENVENQKPTIEYDTSVMLESKYATLERAVKKITETETNKELPFTREWIDNLSIAEGNKVYEAVEALTKKK